VRLEARPEARPPARNARPAAWAAPPARRTASDIPMFTVFLVCGTATSPTVGDPAGPAAPVESRERKLAVVSTMRNRTKEPDQVCADAVDVARQALADDTGVFPDAVGEHLAVEATGD